MNNKILLLRRFALKDGARPLSRQRHCFL